MSGLEGLGAAAGTIGVLETGFASIIVAGAQNDMNGARHPQTISDHHMLAMLPWEFRLPFFLAHIEHTITNMNNRLQATVQIVQRYCGKHRRSSSPVIRSRTEDVALARPWLGRGTGALSHPPPGVPSPRSPLPTGVIEARKLGVWDKVRWVAGDVKELKYLVKTLREYNAELADLLPPSRPRSLDRRVERELMTSPDMARWLVSPDTGDSEQAEDRTELRQVTGVIRGGRECGTSVNGINVPRELSPAPLRLRLADMTFADLASGRTDREFAYYQQAPTIVEWRYYPTKASKQERPYIDAKVYSLSMQLCQLSTVGEVCVLPSLGYVHDERNSRYGHLFGYPRGYDGLTRPMSLQERLRRDHEKHLRCELKERFELARSLALAVYRLLSVNWLHKNLTSENVLLFNECSGGEDDGSSEHGVCRPFVCGFSRSRRDAQLELSEKPATGYGDDRHSEDERLYWDPSRLALFEAANGHGNSATSGNLLAASYQREFDVYSLGILFLEIGFWCLIKRIFRDCRSRSAVDFATELRARYVPELNGRMGKTYTDIVAYCLGSTPGEDAHLTVSENTEDEYMLRTKHFLEIFEMKVVARIEGLYVS
ncbi:hypothetical protein DL764_008011 [Monosporascus ibericus]|uniref:Prion-inhibition and propagation HeLo domain-containing protein n=1 Tax=Monosporascus ibericus TaxID=155417 RepID=A0A4Q4T0T9_9PEZI|nr:hypothetical protein DL764_008011 [Monosporascus ibericus]